MKKPERTAKKDHRLLIIPVFVIYGGCPHRCIFCNQKITAGNFPPVVTEDYFAREVNSYLRWQKDKTQKVEIAFYGGSFTAIAPDYQEKLLSFAQSHIDKGLVSSIRVSTRPDYVNKEIITRLKKYGVATVELGAQSFVDEVLIATRRGHDAAATFAAIELLKEAGFNTGLHLMAGLPRDTKEGFLSSVEKVIQLQPDTVRIHPTVVLKGTPLAAEYESGNFRPLTLVEAIDYCAEAWLKLTAAGIRVIRTGLHCTPEMADNNSVLAGPIHPALGSLVLAAVYYNETIKLLRQVPPDVKEIQFRISQQDIANFRGLKNSNVLAIKKLYPSANIVFKYLREQKRGIISVAAANSIYNTEIPQTR